MIFAFEGHDSSTQLRVKTYKQKKKKICIHCLKFQS